MRAVSFIRRRGLDLVTFAFTLVALYLLAQPTSQLRAAWTEHRTKAKASEMVSRKWTELSDVGSPLFRDSGNVQVVEFSDYECPFCRAGSASVDSAVEAGLRISYLNLPLPSHPRAEGAALAALCAEASGRFREMHARLMNSSQWQTDSNWIREARHAGIQDSAAFNNCLQGPAVRERLSRQRALAESLQVTGTPTFASRTSSHPGLASMKQLLALKPKR